MPENRTINPCQFVQTIRPLIERRDVHAMVTTIKRNWTLAEVIGLLNSPDCDARKVSALVLGLIGTCNCVRDLARQLHHDDPMVWKMAEHAMWSIWLRAGNEVANEHLTKGMAHLEKKQYQHAINEFSLAIAADPKFAEAFNQRAMAYYLLEDYEQCQADCRTAVTLMPLHFGAWAGLGHCQAGLGDIQGAILSYRKAYAINPHLECVHELLTELQSEQ
ncbi:MAG TPA: hypothetical protein PK402_01220 [Tepidisphaeraceae bacterium]|nr:hypothetical protein [Tepidisphaeraceae bacterium]